MARSNEAACLLQSGSIYARRLGFRSAIGGDVFAGIKPGGVSLYFGDAPIYHFDLDGRWQRAFVDGVHYLKGLDGAVRSVDRERESGGLVLRRETLSYATATDMDASIRVVALDLVDDLDSGRLEISPNPPRARALDPEDFRDFLGRVIEWDGVRWFAHRERYLSTYGPIPFLPPDCPNALILQATLGHDGGRAFGRGRPAEHYARSPVEFLDHCRDVRQLVGRRVAQYRGIFLGGADVLRLPVDRIVEILEGVGCSFPIGPRGDGDRESGDRWDDFTPNLGLVHAFLDDFQGRLPDLESWRKLRLANLGRVTLGVESGDPDVRADYGKGWLTEDLRGVVSDLKACGIGVGLVVLAGAGGRASSAAHLRATADLLDSLPIGAGDLVSLVDARSLDDLPGDAPGALTDEETSAQLAGFKRWWADSRPSKGPKLVAYNPDKRRS